ncbi:hypothetical protein [Elioraea sp.]|uniref:hypothetical protein n=1 Tax=Elioraea sp. TaxID=2185103 RepID=UPI0025C2209D|nr:hypothetical protein [Elioraea sp.]
MQRPSHRRTEGARLARIAGTLSLAVLLAGCSSVVGTGFSGSGNGFGGFGGARQPATEADGYTMRRLTGRDDAVEPLQPDTTISWPKQDEERPSVFETEDERRAREGQPRQGQSRRGSSSESPDIAIPREDVTQPRRTEPRALASPPPPDNRGQGIPGAPAGTVTTGGAGSTGTFGGPAGSGTVLRDGGTTTLMGADGTIRTVPTPR